jgi:hypothetical protein
MVQRSNQLSVRRLENRKRTGRWMFRLGMGMLAAWNAGDLMAQHPGTAVGLSDAPAVAGQSLAGNPVWQGAPEAGMASGPMTATPTIMGDSLGMGSTVGSYDASGLQQPMHFQAAQPQINGHAMTGGDCFQGCPRSFYASFDAMWMNQVSDEFTLSYAQQMDGSDYQFGGRYTIGQQFDCLDGVEAVYVGPFNWQESAVTTGTNLDSRLIPVDGFAHSMARPPTARDWTGVSRAWSSIVAGGPGTSSDCWWASRGSNTRKTTSSTPPKQAASQEAIACRQTIC